MKPSLKLLWVTSAPAEAEPGLRVLEESFLVQSVFVTDGESFRRALQAEPWDLIIANCQLPGFTGRQAFDILQKLDKKIPFIFFSELAHKSLAKECTRHGLCDFVFKEHIEMLEIAAHRLLCQMERALQPSSAEVALREDVDRLRMMLDICQSLLDSRDLSYIITQLLEKVFLIAGVDGAAFYLRQSGEWVLREAVGFSPEFRACWGSLPLETDWIKGLVTFDEMLSWPAAPEQSSWLLEAPGPASWIATCLPDKDAPGLLLAASREAGHFTIACRGWLRELARLSRHIISNARIFELVARAKIEWETSLDALSDLIVIYDAEGVIRRVNQALSNRLNLPYNAILGKKSSEVFGDISLRLDFFSTENLNGTLPTSREIEDRSRGETFQVSCVPIQDSNGTRIGMIQVAKDITLEKRLREQLIQRETLSALGELVAGVAHELNNPLTGVIGYSQLLAARLDLAPEIRTDLERIAGEGARAGKIVQSLLTFARQQSSAKVLTSIEQLFDNTLELFTFEIKHAGVQVVKQYDVPLQEIWADAGQLQQIFVNLVSNALHAMEGMGRPPLLSVKIWQNGKWMNFRIRDNGCGIAKKNLARVFDPFFTTKPMGKGTGLGLSISFGLILSHGGEITVNSEEGQWTEFNLRLPLCPEIGEEMRQAASHAVSADQRMLQVLVVDDDPVILNLVREILTYEGHTVHLASTAQAGLNSLQHADYDVILFEIKLPDLGGEEIYSEVQKHYPAMLPRLLFLTAELIDPNIRLFLERTGSGWLAKPFSIPELVQAVANIAGKSQKQGERG